MARVNIEDSIFKEDRYVKICVAAGGRIPGIGAIACLWIEAQKYYLEFGEIPAAKWIESGLPEYLISTGWAERTESGVIAHGQDKQFKWLKQSQAAGEASAKARQNKSGTTKPQIKPTSTVVHENNEPPNTVSQALTLSLSQKKENTITKTNHDEVGIAYQVWNDTRKSFGLPSTNRSPPEESSIARAIKQIGFENVILALEGQRYEQPHDQWHPKNHLKLDRVLHRDAKGQTRWETFRDLALLNRGKNKKLTEEEIDDIATGRVNA